MNVGRQEPEREGALGCLREREKEEKSPHSPPVLCRTFSFDPPLLFLLPSTSHTHTHTSIHTHRPTDLQDTVVASILYLPQCCFNTYLHYNSVFVPTGRSKQD